MFSHTQENFFKNIKQLNKKNARALQKIGGQSGQVGIVLIFNNLQAKISGQANGQMGQKGAFNQ